MRVHGRRERCICAVQNLGEQVAKGFGLVCVFARQHLVNDASKRVAVTLGVVWLALANLGAQIVGRAYCCHGKLILMRGGPNIDLQSDASPA